MAFDRTAQSLSLEPESRVAAPIADQMPAMSPPEVAARFLPAGDTSLAIEFGDVVDRAISDRVLALAAAIERRGIAGVIELVPTFRSLMVHYDPLLLSHAELLAEIEPLMSGLASVHPKARLWVLPSCYDTELGPDLAEVAERTRHSIDDVVKLHTAVDYHVYALGFLPGYPYMGDGPEALSLPRRENPRIRVPMGSICIAFRQAGVYSLESPGGWHLLGRTPARLFDLRRSNPVLLAPGDKVRFQPVSRETFERLEDDASAGRLALEPLEVVT